MILAPRMLPNGDRDERFSATYADALIAPTRQAKRLQSGRASLHRMTAASSLPSLRAHGVVL